MLYYQYFNLLGAMEWWNRACEFAVGKNGILEEKSYKQPQYSIINFVELRFAPVPLFQKHNISIKVLINNDITNNLISNSR